MMRADLLERARTAAVESLAVHSGTVDATDAFPELSVKDIGDAGLLNLMVPEHLGGASGSFRDLAEIGAALGEGCLSTAMIWAMHSQQVAILARHGQEVHHATLRELATSGDLVASVTTERGKGGDLMTADAAIETAGDTARVRRDAPVVSYGGEARAFVVLMRSGPDRPRQDVCLVLLTRDDSGSIDVTGPWRAHGMRGTRSVPMSFDVTVPADRIIAGDFREIAGATMVPAGHIAWAAAWHGAARGAFTRVSRWCRAPGKSNAGGFRSELTRSRLADLRVSLDLVEALLYQTAARMDAAAVDPDCLTTDAVIALNNLKIAASERSYAVVDGLVELVGMPMGYLRETPLRLEQVLRDLRSASLMFSNERIRQINGRLIAVEHQRGALRRTPSEATVAG